MSLDFSCRLLLVVCCFVLRIQCLDNFKNRARLENLPPAYPWSLKNHIKDGERNLAFVLLASIPRGNHLNTNSYFPVKKLMRPKVQMLSIASLNRSMPAWLRPHQQEAVACLRERFDFLQEDRATIVMPPGAGKTYVGMIAVEDEFMRSEAFAVVVLPQLPLIDQTIEAYRKSSVFSEISILVVGSDCADAEAVTTTEVAAISGFLKSHVGKRCLIFSTYDSLPRLSEAVRKSGVQLGLAVFDEAHVMAGRSQKFSYGLRNTHFSVERRLFLTATPRIYSKRFVDAASGESNTNSMDDISSFGPTVYKLSNQEAIDAGIVVPLKLLVFNASAAYKSALRRGADLTVVADDNKIPRSRAELVALTMDAMKKFNVSKVISFHARIKDTQDFQADAEILMPHLSLPFPKPEVLATWGAMSAERIKSALHTLNTAQHCIVANPRVLCTGIDAPGVDMVLMASPRRSHTHILQMAGRATRIAPGKKEGFVLIPIRDENVESLDEGSETFRAMLSILRVLIELDEQLQQRLEIAMTNQGLRGKCLNANDILEGIIIAEEVDPSFLVRSLSAIALRGLANPWDEWYGRLKAYKDAHGHCDVLYNFVTADGFRLGQWLATQRKNYKKGLLGTSQQARLDELGVVWDQYAAAWEDGFAKLKLYKEANSDCEVPQRYETADGFRLGKWLGRQRHYYKKGLLGNSQHARLDELGVVWEPWTLAWEDGFAKLKLYKEANSDCEVPQRFQTADGFKLGQWLGKQRQNNKKGLLGNSQQARLDELGVVWDPLTAAWENGFTKIKFYKDARNNCEVPHSFETADGFKLGRWLTTQRQNYKKGLLGTSQQARLDELGMVWEPWAAKWEDGFSKLKLYKEARNDCKVPYDFVTADGFRLGQWLATQRKNYKKGLLGTSQQARLDEVGVIWDQVMQAWEDGFTKLKLYKEANRDCNVPQRFETADGFQLGKWLGRQRKNYKKGLLGTSQHARLDELGVVWEPLTAAWENGFTELKFYKEANSHCEVPQRYETADGFKLGQWLGTQRQNYKKGLLGNSQQARLDELGMVWHPLTAAWENGFTKIKLYKEARSDCKVPYNFETADGFKLGQWLATQRKSYKKGLLGTSQQARLDELGVVWDR